jgi:multicomponent Na+:H+ antiporter subunit G
VTRLLIDILLAMAVLSMWLGCLGFARLRTPLDRVHCVAFVNATSGVAILIAAVLADGASIRVFKILIIVGASLLGGAAISHATGRAFFLRNAKAKSTESS